MCFVKRPAAAGRANSANSRLQQPVEAASANRQLQPTLLQHFNFCCSFRIRQTRREAQQQPVVAVVDTGPLRLCSFVVSEGLTQMRRKQLHLNIKRHWRDVCAGKQHGGRATLTLQLTGSSGSRKRSRYAQTMLLMISETLLCLSFLV